MDWGHFQVLSPEIVTVKFKDFHGSVAIAVVNSETIQVVDEGRCCSLASYQAHFIIWRCLPYAAVRYIRNWKISCIKKFISSNCRNLSLALSKCKLSRYLLVLMLFQRPFLQPFTGVKFTKINSLIIETKEKTQTNTIHLICFIHITQNFAWK